MQMALSDIPATNLGAKGRQAEAKERRSAMAVKEVSEGGQRRVGQ